MLGIQSKFQTCEKQKNRENKTPKVLTFVSTATGVLISELLISFFLKSASIVFSFAHNSFSFKNMTQKLT